MYLKYRNLGEKFEISVHLIYQVLLRFYNNSNETYAKFDEKDIKQSYNICHLRIVYNTKN